MNSKKLTELTASGSPAAGDLFYVVDVSDTTDSANGTSKKVTADYLTSAIRLSAELDEGSPIAPASIEALLATASSTGRPLIIDASFTLSGDILVDEAVHIIVQPNVTISMADSPTWDNGVSAADNTRYLGGMFMFRTGAEGSVFDATTATFNVNEPNAGSVAGESVTPSAIAIFGCDNVTLRGTPIINTTFSGVTVVDSDYFRMLEPWHCESPVNATIDAEASDHGYAIASCKNGVEVIDIQIYCDDWDVIAFGENLDEAAVEVNNSWNIRVYSTSVNSKNVDLFDYADGSSATLRWTARARAYRVNRHIHVKSRASFDANFNNAAAATFDVCVFRDCELLTYDVDIRVTGTTDRISRFVWVPTGGDNFGSHGKIYIKSDSNNLSASDSGLIYFNSGRRHYSSIFVEYPLASGDAALEFNNCQFCVFDIDLIYDTGGSGTGVLASGTVGTTVNLRNTDNIFNCSTDVDVTGVTSGTVQQYN